MSGDVYLILTPICNKPERRRPEDSLEASFQFKPPDEYYYDEYNRLESFPRKWDNSIPKDVLAKSGLYNPRHDASDEHVFTGIVCAFCCCQKPNVNNNDSIEKFHISNCPAINGEAEGNIPLGEVNNYRFEKHRLITFLRTSWDYPVTPDDLARSGFYWTGERDKTRCTFCRLEVSSWEEGDSADGEHRRWNPNCVFMEGRFVNNVKLGEEHLELPLQCDLGTGGADAPGNVHCSPTSARPTPQVPNTRPRPQIAESPRLQKVYNENDIQKTGPIYI